MMSAKARIRSASAGVFAVAASLSRLAAIVLSWAASLLRMRRFGLIDGSVQRVDRLRGERLPRRQLVDIGTGDHEICGPGDLRLVLNIELVEMHLVGCVDFILRDVFVRHQLEDVDAAGDLRTVDVAVVPVGGPLAAQRALGRVDRAAVEVGDLERDAWCR